MSNSARPKFLNKAMECKTCKKRTFPLTSTMECRDCNPRLFYLEYQKGKEDKK